MTHTLRVTDGAGTVTLSDVSSGDTYWMDYTPQVAVDMSAPLKESLSVRFGKTIQNARDNVNALNRLFYQAQAYNRTKTGNKVYVELDPGGTSTPWRSQLFEGAIKPVDDTLKSVDWSNKSLSFDVEWTRQPFWEGTLTPVPLTNVNGTANTAGLTVTNVNDNTGQNWVAVTGSDIAGDLPAPIKVQMLNATNGSDSTDEIFVWHNVYSTPASFAPILEGEASAGSVTPTGTSTCSAGSAVTIAWGTTSAETSVATWTVSAAQMGYAKGGNFAILARWHGLFPYNDCWVRMRLGTTSTWFVVHEGDLSLASPIASGRELKVIDTVQLPPYLAGETSVKELSLVMYAKRTGGGTINLDYLQLSPISGDSGWLRFKSVARGVPYNCNFVHDDIEGVTYRDDGTNKISEFTQYGGPILLVPQQAQRLYFNTSDYNGYAKINQQWTVRLWYRPRRSSI